MKKNICIAILSILFVVAVSIIIAGRYIQKAPVADNFLKKTNHITNKTTLKKDRLTRDAKLLLTRGDRSIVVKLFPKEYCYKLLSASKTNVAFATLYNVVNVQPFVGRFSRLVKITIPSDSEKLAEYRISSLLEVKKEKVLNMIPAQLREQFEKKYNSKHDLLLSGMQPTLVPFIDYVSPNGKFIVLKLMIPKIVIDKKNMNIRIEGFPPVWKIMFINQKRVEDNVMRPEKFGKNTDKNKML